MVEHHAGTERSRLRMRRAAVADRFLDEARLVEQLVAIEDLFLVPGQPIESEAQPGAFPATVSRRGVRRVLGEVLEGRGDRFTDDFRFCLAPVFPREIAVPVAPHRIRRLELTALPRQ